MVLFTTLILTLLAPAIRLMAKSVATRQLSS